MQEKIKLRCVCGKEVGLENTGGQYQDEYRGECRCGRRWLLKELTEALVEISDCIPEKIIVR